MLHPGSHEPAPVDGARPVSSQLARTTDRVAHAASCRVSRRTQLCWLYAGLLAFNLLTWAAALLLLPPYPLLLGMAGLAYTLGIRHAIDADHLAAIDNTTRKLMQAGERPLAVGLFFSLGHSTVVVIGALVLAAAAGTMTGWLQPLNALGGLVGAGVSAGFLLAIALLNVLILRSTYCTWRRMRRGDGYTAQHDRQLLAPQGPLVRLLRPLFKLITRSWHMYPLGLLFGLSFDTATEIGVLGISASQAARGLQLGSTLLFPLLFTAGMSLLDTLDSTLMVSAYEWAFIRPARKLHYNIAVTCASVLIALLVATLEALQLLARQLRLSGPPWSLIEALNAHLTALGCLIIGIFAASWLIAVLLDRTSGREDLETRADPG